MDNDEAVMNAATAESAPAAPPETGETGGAAGAAAQLAALAAERDQLEAEKLELADRLLRRTADFENFRRRIERERAELLEFASSTVVGELLPVLDDFERALQAGSSDKEYARGMELIYQRLLETLKRNGLEPLASVGQKFDPHLHHAVEMAADTDAEDQTILEERARGYNFKGRLLRPAMVKVAVKA
jgi:molecular chaperone GrpE